MRRSAALIFWRLLNPFVRPLAGIAPWWVLVETVGRKTGKTRRTPLAVGRRDASGMWVVAVHGRGAGWLLNAEAAETVRYRYRMRWSTAVPVVHPWDDAIVATMGAYARSGLHVSADNPLVVQFAPVA